MSNFTPSVPVHTVFLSNTFKNKYLFERATDNGGGDKIKREGIGKEEDKEGERGKG